MKTKIKLPTNKLLEENKNLKELLRVLFDAYETKEKQIETLKWQIIIQKKIEKNLEKQLKIIAKELAKIDVHFHGLNDEEFKEYREKNI